MTSRPDIQPIQVGLNAFRDLMTLVFISGDNSHIYSDAYLMSQTLFGLPIVWAVLDGRQSSPR